MGCKNIYMCNKKEAMIYKWIKPYPHTYQHNMEREKPNPTKGVTHHVGDDGKASPGPNLTVPLKLLHLFQIPLSIIFPHNHTHLHATTIVELHYPLCSQRLERERKRERSRDEYMKLFLLKHIR